MNDLEPWDQSDRQKQTKVKDKIFCKVSNNVSKNNASSVHPSQEMRLAHATALKPIWSKCAHDCSRLHYGKLILACSPSHMLRDWFYFMWQPKAGLNSMLYKNRDNELRTMERRSFETKQFYILKFRSFSGNEVVWHAAVSLERSSTSDPLYRASCHLVATCGLIYKES